MRTIRALGNSNYFQFSDSETANKFFDFYQNNDNGQYIAIRRLNRNVGDFNELYMPRLKQELNDINDTSSDVSIFVDEVVSLCSKYIRIFKEIMADASTVTDITPSIEKFNNLINCFQDICDNFKIVKTVSEVNTLMLELDTQVNNMVDTVKQINGEFIIYYKKYMNLKGDDVKVTAILTNELQSSNVVKKRLISRTVAIQKNNSDSGNKTLDFMNSLSISIPELVENFAKKVGLIDFYSLPRIRFSNTTLEIVYDIEKNDRTNYDALEDSYVEDYMKHSDDILNTYRDSFTYMMDEIGMDELVKCVGKEYDNHKDEIQELYLENFNKTISKINFINLFITHNYMAIYAAIKAYVRKNMKQQLKSLVHDEDITCIITLVKDSKDYEDFIAKKEKVACVIKRTSSSISEMKNELQDSIDALTNIDDSQSTVKAITPTLQESLSEIIQYVQDSIDELEILKNAPDLKNKLKQIQTQFNEASNATNQIITEIGKKTANRSRKRIRK